MFCFFLKLNKKHGRLFVTNTRHGLVAVGWPPSTPRTSLSKNNREESTRIQVLRSEWKSRASCARVCWWMMPKEERQEAAGSVFLCSWSLCGFSSQLHEGTPPASLSGGPIRRKLALLPVGLVEVEALALPFRLVREFRLDRRWFPEALCYYSVVLLIFALQLFSERKHPQNPTPPTPRLEKKKKKINSELRDF